MFPIDENELSKRFLAEPLIDELVQPFDLWVSLFKMDDGGVSVKLLPKRKGFKFFVDVDGSSKDIEVLEVFKRDFDGRVFRLQSSDFVAVAEVAPSCLKLQTIFYFAGSDAGVSAVVLAEAAGDEVALRMILVARKLRQVAHQVDVVPVVTIRLKLQFFLLELLHLMMG